MKIKACRKSGPFRYLNDNFHYKMTFGQFLCNIQVLSAFILLFYLSFLSEFYLSCEVCKCVISDITHDCGKSEATPHFIRLPFIKLTATEAMPPFLSLIATSPSERLIFTEATTYSPGLTDIQATPSSIRLKDTEVTPLCLNPQNPL